MKRPDRLRVHVLISGRVQGVAFRFFTEKWASSLGLTGWVRNLFDGRVEIVAEGGREEISRFLEFLREGPRHAHVEDVAVDWEDYSGEFMDFRIVFSAF
ncbi:MAG: acylphosphatase [Acidobacteriota bacterium]|nr:acylphosphatase [Acidobacteriota bacterium]